MEFLGEILVGHLGYHGSVPEQHVLCNPDSIAELKQSSPHRPQHHISVLFVTVLCNITFSLLQLATVGEDRAITNVKQHIYFLF